MRIIGGKLRGRRLHGPGTLPLRPTSDRMREAVFNVLAHDRSIPAIDGARVLDLFAGSGALGLEAVSRGAEFALLVETHRATRSLAQANAEALGVGDQVKVFQRNAARLGKLPEGRDPFNFVFCDPPYGRGLGEQALASALEGGWLAAEAIVILEEHTDTAVAPPGFAAISSLQHGETRVMILRRS